MGRFQTGVQTDVLTGEGGDGPCLDLLDSSRKRTNETTRDMIYHESHGVCDRLKNQRSEGRNSRYKPPLNCQNGGLLEDTSQSIPEYFLCIKLEPPMLWQVLHHVQNRPLPNLVCVPN